MGVEEGASDVEGDVDKVGSVEGDTEGVFDGDIDIEGLLLGIIDGLTVGLDVEGLTVGS